MGGMVWSVIRNISSGCEVFVDRGEVMLPHDTKAWNEDINSFDGNTCSVADDSEDKADIVDRFNSILNRLFRLLKKEGRHFSEIQWIGTK
jgi:hypothetical protein